MYILWNNIQSTTIDWDENKNELLKRKRGVSFEAIAEALAQEGPLWIENHPRPEKYPGQRIFAVFIKGYVFLVPFEETHEKITLKTIYPSRKATRRYRLSGGKSEN